MGQDLLAEREIIVSHRGWISLIRLEIRSKAALHRPMQQVAMGQTTMSRIWLILVQSAAVKKAVTPF